MLPFAVFAKGPNLSQSVLFFAALGNDSSLVVLPIYVLCEVLLVLL